MTEVFGMWPKRALCEKIILSKTDAIDAENPQRRPESISSRQVEINVKIKTL